MYHGLGYSKSAGDRSRLDACAERRANEICCSLRNLVNPSDLVIADSRRLASRGCPGRRSRCGFVLGTALIAAIDLDGNGREQPLELDVVEVLQ